MVEMLVTQCPNLEDLQVLQQLDTSDYNDTAEALFTDGRWPRLKRATIETYCLDADLADRFFAKHPLLESLCIRGSNRDIVFRHESLPSLRFLQLGWTPTLEAIADVASSLEGLVVLSSDFADDTRDTFAPLTNVLTSLRFLTVLDAHYDVEILKSITRLAPTLEKLALAWIPLPSSDDDMVCSHCCLCSYCLPHCDRILNISASSFLNFRCLPTSAY